MKDLGVNVNRKSRKHRRMKGYVVAKYILKNVRICISENPLNLAYEIDSELYMQNPLILTKKLSRRFIFENPSKYM